MTPEQQSQIDAVERDRHKREAELLILLLLIFGKATSYAVNAVRLGHDPSQAARSVIVGNPALDLPGMAPAAGNLLSVTYIEGMRRAARMAGKAPNATAAEIPQELADFQARAAANMADGMAQTMTKKITDALADARQAGIGTAKTAKAVREAIAEAGYAEANPYLLESVAEVQVVAAHGAGMWNNWHDPHIAEHLVGFRHETVMDDGTTKICECRNEFARPKDDPYWKTNWCPLHWGCRSVILPLFREEEWTLAAPGVPPAPGFGWAMSPLSYVSW